MQAREHARYGVVTAESDINWFIRKDYKFSFLGPNELGIYYPRGGFCKYFLGPRANDYGRIHDASNFQVHLLREADRLEEQDASNPLIEHLRARSEAYIHYGLYGGPLPVRDEAEMKLMQELAERDT